MLRRQWGAPAKWLVCMFGASYRSMFDRALVTGRRLSRASKGPASRWADLLVHQVLHTQSAPSFWKLGSKILHYKPPQEWLSHFILFKTLSIIYEGGMNLPSESQGLVIHFLPTTLRLLITVPSGPRYSGK